MVENIAVDRLADVDIQGQNFSEKPRPAFNALPFSPALSRPRAPVISQTRKFTHTEK